jgi:dihydropteroate synthase
MVGPAGMRSRLSLLDTLARTAQSDRMIATMSRPAAAAGPAGHPLLPALLSRAYPAVMGVLNVTPDSFSDGGQFAAP